MEASPRWPWTETPTQPQAPPPVPSPLTDLAAVTEHMHEALEHEITAINREDPPLVPLPTGVLIAKGDGPLPLYRYHFGNAPSWVRARACTKLVVADRIVTAYVHSRAQDGGLVLDVPVDLGPTIEDAALEEGTAWLLRALQIALGQLPWGFNAPLALAAVGEAPIPRLGPDQRIESLLPGIDEEINEEQLHALQIGLRAPLAFIWGPPGTGKTETLAALADAHVAAGRRVLLLCPTNRSLDEGVARVAKRLRARSALDVGTVVRYGELAARHRNCCGIPLEHSLLPPESLRTCLVLAMTVHMAYLLPTVVADFDTVIVDEAGAMILPLAFWAAGLGRSRVTFIGDSRQLGPVVRAKTVAAQRWLKRDVFAASGVSDLIAAEEDPRYLGALRTQYRMDPAISGLVSRLYYEERLRPAISVLQRKPLPCALTEDNTLVLVDTSGTGASQTSRVDGRGEGGRAACLTNPVHAHLVARILHHMAEDMHARGTQAGVSVAVLAPYRDQVRLHRETWGEAFGAWSVPTTVHACQGGEIDTVVLDLTDAPSSGVSPFFSSENRDDCTRLLNVALSRARRRMIVLANVQWLMKRASAPVRDLLAELREHAFRLRVKDLG